LLLLLLLLCLVVVVVLLLLLLLLLLMMMMMYKGRVEHAPRTVTNCFARPALRLPVVCKAPDGNCSHIVTCG
jgi:hypothetical protein